MQKKIPGYCALCISRCGCISTVEDGVLTKISAFPQHPTGKSLCIKGKAAPDIVYSPDRVLTPLKRTTPKSATDPEWQAISWQEALNTISQKLKIISQISGAEAVAFGVTTPSGTGISDSFVWINRLAHAFGSPNTLFATENCNWHKDFAPIDTFGQSIGMPDYEKTGCILLWGFNPATSWLVQAELINKAIKRGAKLIVIDPRKAGLANRADQWLRVRPASDGILAMALAHQLITKDWYNKDFIRDWTNAPLLLREDNQHLLTPTDLGLDNTQKGYFAWDKSTQKVSFYHPKTGKYQTAQSNLAIFGHFKISTANGSLFCKTVFQQYADECAQYSPEKAEKLTDIPASQIKETARLLRDSAPVSYFTWTGTAQQAQATQTGRAIALLYALTGDIDASGGNCYFNKPALNNVFALDLLSPQQKNKMLGLKARPLGPAKMGWITSTDLYQSVVEKKPYQTKALISFGGNPLLTKPNANTAEKALAELEFYVHADLFLNPSAQYADIILPVTSPWERSGFYPGFQVSQQADNFVQLRPQVIKPLGESRSDAWIVFELAKRLGLSSDFFEGDLEAGLQYLIEPSGLTLDELKAHPEGIYLALKTRYKKYQQVGFSTPSKKLELFSETYQKAGYSPIPQFKTKLKNHVYPLRLISAKWIAYCHSQQRQIKSLRKRQPDPLVEIHPQTAVIYGIKKDDWIIIETKQGKIKAKAKLNKSLAEDVICSQYGWWHENYNNLIDEHIFDPISSSNVLKDYACRIGIYHKR